MHVRVGFCVFVLQQKRAFSRQARNPRHPPLSFSQIFCIAQLVQSYLKRVEVLGSNLHFLGGFFIPALSRTLPATSTIFFSKSHNFFIRKPFSEPFFLEQPNFSRSIHWNTYFQHLQLQFFLKWKVHAKSFLTALTTSNGYPTWKIYLEVKVSTE